MPTPTLEQTVRGLVSVGEYKLAFRLIWNQYRIQGLLRSKARHNRRQAKVLRKTEKLNQEIMMFKFKSEIEFL